MAGFGAKVKLNVDRSTAAKQDFNNQINSMVNQIKISNKFTVLQKDMDRVRREAQAGLDAAPIKIKNIDCSQAVTKLRRDIQNVINSLSIKNGVTISGLVDPSGTGAIATEIKDVTAAAKAGQAEIDRMNAQMNVLKTTMQSLASVYKTALPGGKNPIVDTTELNSIIARYTELQQKIETIRSSNSVASREELDALQKEALAIQSKITAIQNEQTARAKAAAEAARASTQAQANAKAEEDELVRRNKLYEQLNTRLNQVQKAQRDWTAAATGKSSAAYAQLDGYSQRLKSVIANFNNLSESQIRSELSNISAGFKNTSTVIKEAGENTRTFSERIGGLSKKFTTWLSISQVIMLAYRSIREMISDVIDLDTAMTELKKVTDETDATYSEFLDNAVVRAKELGATVSDVVTATADFARLGYDIVDASQLADAAIVYKNVGDGIEDISEASESIISTMQAFGIAAEDSMTIVDKFNEVGNNFAISSQGVGEALLRSASALAAGNNTLDESIALITTANTIVQNPEAVGTTMKTISMYLRAAKTEAEEAGESTEGMANSVSELRSEILSLTNNKVDIQIDEDTFKSTYQIIKELSAVWDDLTDITQANILEMVGGKRNSNVVAALIENFGIAEDVVNDAANSAGSALAENEKYLESINGKIAEFKATFQELGETLIGSDFIKQVVEFGTTLLNILNAIAKVVDAVGGLNTILYTTVSIIAIIKAESLVSLLSGLASRVVSFGGNVTAFFQLFREGMVAAKAAGSSTLGAIGAGFKSVAGLASTAQLAVAGFIAVFTVITLVKNGIEEARQETIALAEATIEAKNAEIENANALKDAYLTYKEYSSRVDLTSAEEIELQSALDKVTEAMEGKASALSGLKQGTEEYTQALEDQIATELKTREIAAKERSEAAKDKLMAESYSDWDGSQISIVVSDSAKEETDSYKLVQEIMGEFLDDGTYYSGHGVGAQEYEIEPIDWDTNKNVDSIVEYYYKLLELKDALVENDLMDTDDVYPIYDSVKEVIDAIGPSVEEYVEAEYDRVLSAYESTNGIVDTIDEFTDMREYINSELGNKFGFDGLDDLIDNYLIEESSIYKGYLDDLTSAEIQAEAIREKRESIIKKIFPTDYEDLEPGTMSHFHAMDQWTLKTEELRQKLNELSEEELDVAYQAVLEDGATTWEEISAALDEYNNSQSVAVRRAEELKTRISEMWSSDEFADAKADLLELADTVNGITPDAITDLASESDILAEILAEDGMNAEFLASIMQSMADGGAGLSMVTAEALKLNDALDGMVDMFDQVTDAKSRYDSAMSVDEKDTDFRSYVEAFEELNAQFEAGTTNSNAFWAAAEFLFGSDQLALWGWSDGLDEIYEAMQKNAKVFSDADSAGAGFIERLYQMDQAGEMVNEEGEKLLTIGKDASGAYFFDIDPSNIEAIAEKMGITEEAVLACLEALSMWGDVDFYDLTEVAEVIDEIGLSAETASGKAINVERLTEQLLTLGKTDKEIYDVLTALETIDGVELFSVSEDVGTLAQKLQDLKIATSDGVTITVDYEGLGDLLANLGYTKDEAEGLITKLDEADNITLANADGEIKDVSDALDYINSLTFTEVQASVDGIGDAIDGVDEKSTDNAVSEIEGIGEAADVAVTKVYEIGNAIDSVDGKTATVYYDVRRKNSILGSLFGFAEGTKDAPEGDALVGEEGIELVKSGNKAYVVGVDGAEIVHLNEGDQVYPNEETKRILNGSGRGIRGVIPAYASGRVTTSGLRVETDKEGTVGTPYKVEVDTDIDVSLDDSELEDQLKEKLDEMEEAINEIIGNFEHSIFLLEKNDGSVTQIIALYRKMQDAVHEQAEQYRALGLDENSDYIQDMQKQWWDYEDAIKDVKEQVVEDILDMVNATSSAVDDIQNVFDTLKNAADEYAENGGFISVDTFQEIMDLGPQYLQYLRDENGLLVINEESLNRVLAAKTEQLALDNAMAYVERLRLALNNESLEDLNNLLYATTETTNATWGLVYASLALLDLNDDQYQAALHNINAIRALAANAISGIGQVSANTSEHLEEMKQGLDDILQYVMDMLRDRIEEQIEALEEEKEAYADLIELKKESLAATQEETDYQDEVASKIKEIAKLQERINALSLDDSREAQSQKASLEEELMELQKELADTQADYAVDAQQDSLDKMQEAYEAEKDKEIAALEESISSTQKLYDMAIAYIQSNWSTLKDELIAWNYEVGNSLESELVTAWNNAYAAAQKYGSYVSALNSIDADIEAAGSGGSNTIVGNTNYGNESSSDENIHAIIKEMYANSQAHHTASTEEKARLNKRNLTLGAMLAQYGITAVRGDDGVWYINKVGGEKLYDKYRQYCYHSGGIAGDQPTLKQNEVMAILEKGEPVLDKKKENGLYKIIDFTSALSEKLGRIVNTSDLSSLFTGMKKDLENVNPSMSNVTNNESDSVSFGDVYIYGASDETVEKHREVNRKFVNEVLEHLNIKR